MLYLLKVLWYVDKFIFHLYVHYFKKFILVILILCKLCYD